ncbi:hypothetical protein D0T60_13905 [Bacteroides sp. 224]|nr:hypothetical protein [Bacteroides sp. 224]
MNAEFFFTLRYEDENIFSAFIRSFRFFRVSILIYFDLTHFYLILLNLQQKNGFFMLKPIFSLFTLFFFFIFEGK